MMQKVLFSGEKSKRYILILDGIVLMLGFIGILQIYHKAGLPVQLNLQNEGLIVSTGTTDKNGMIIPRGTILLSVEEIPLSSFEDLEFVCDGFESGNIVRAKLISANEVYQAEFRLIPFYSTFYLLTVCGLAFIVFCVGIIVLLKKPIDDKAALTFHGMMLAAYGIMTMTWGNYTFPSLFTGTLNRILFSFSYAVVPFFFLWFTFAFPREKTRYMGKIILILSAIPIVLSVGMGITAWHAIYQRSISWFNLYELWFDACRIYFAVSVLTGVANFIHTYRRSSEQSEKKRLKWIFFGTLTGPLSFLLFWQIPQLFTSEGLIPEEFILILVAIFPLTYGFSIVRYHIFDINQVFRRSTIYGLSLLAVLGIYIFIVGGASVLAGHLTVANSVLLSAVSSIVTALLFQPLREKVKSFVDKRFFLVKFNKADAQLEIARRLESVLSIKQASEALMEEIQRNIPVTYCCLYILNTQLPESGTVYTVKGEKEENPEIIAFAHSLFKGGVSARPLIRNGHVEEVSRIDELNVTGDTLEIIHAVVPFIANNGKIIAGLMLGEKKSEFIFTVEELELFSFCGNQFASAIERIELEYHLRYEKELSSRLKELNDLKSFFVSSVSHDLKTPLTSIKMFAEILQGSGVQEADKQKYLRIIEGESERLTRLINNVLDFARIEKGIKEYTIAECNLTALVRAVMLVMHYQFQMNAFQTEEYYESEDMPVLADKDAVTEAFVNIVCNAIRYSDKTKFLKIAVTRRGKDIKVAFIDKGVGIPENKRGEIFEPYKRLNNPLTKSSGGMGIGLAIVKHIAEVHKGEVESFSNEFGGTTFLFTLPALSIKTDNANQEE